MFCRWRGICSPLSAVAKWRLPIMNQTDNIFKKFSGQILAIAFILHCLFLSGCSSKHAERCNVRHERLIEDDVSRRDIERYLDEVSAWRSEVNNKIHDPSFSIIPPPAIQNLIDLGYYYNVEIDLTNIDLPDGKEAGYQAIKGIIPENHTWYCLLEKVDERSAYRVARLKGTLSSDEIFCLVRELPINDLNESVIQVPARFLQNIETFPLGCKNPDDTESERIPEESGCPRP